MPSASIVGLAVFLGSFLLFAVQPMMGRLLLPSFGGSAAVWTVCLAAYQLLLLAGYGYAHALARWDLRRQRRLHGALLALAVAWMAVLLAARTRIMPHVGGSAAPIAEVLGCVALGVGLPYVLLASGSSLLQAWLARGGADRRVYGLYAVSNFGSFLGLLSYPLLVEPFVPLKAQWWAWCGGLLVYAGLVGSVGRVRNAECGMRNAECGMRNGECGGRSEANDGQDAGAVSALRAPHAALPGDFPAVLSRPWLWFALPACSSYLLVAFTNHLSLDVEPVPLMWVLLLGAFLLSYTVGFSGWAQKALPLWMCLAAAALGFQAWHGLRPVRGAGFLAEMAGGAAAIFLLGLFLHSWLYRIRPETGRLTLFYLGIAAGGAAGGALASLLAPVLFRQVLEYPIALALAAGLVGWFAWRLNHRELKGLNEAILAVALCLPLVLGYRLAGGGRDVIARARNFYGTLRVTRVAPPPAADGPVWPMHRLMNGETLHGLQIRHPQLWRLGTAYYGPLGGGLAVLAHPAYSNRPLRVACIGLGAGTMSVYGRTNDFYRFFEINPQVVAVAGNTNFFTYLADCRARLSISTGDARKRLEAEATGGEAVYDVLIVDAYSGDAIPIHLATLEAFRLYLRRLAPDGILAVHVSNWHMDLLPLCKAAGRALGLACTGVQSDAVPQRLTTAARWVLMTREPLALPALPRGAARQIDWAQVRDMRAPTDERGSLLQLVRFGGRPPLAEQEVRPEDLDAMFR
jgi:spermidine synthase